MTSKDKREYELRKAALNGDRKKAQSLLERGVNVDTKTIDGYTPLLLASKKGHKEIVEMLLRSKPDMEAKDKKFGSTPLLSASYNGHKDIVDILLQHNSDINSTNTYGNTPLSLAILKGHRYVVETLLEHNPDVAAKDIHGNTPLLLASYYGHKAIVNALLEKTQQLDINATNNEGKTALQYAREKSHFDIASTLEKVANERRYMERIRSSITTRVALDARIRELQQIILVSSMNLNHEDHGKGIEAENELQVIRSLCSKEEYKTSKQLKSDITSFETIIAHTVKPKERKSLLEKLKRTKQQFQDEIAAQEQSGKNAGTNCCGLTPKARNSSGEDPTMMAISYDQLMEVRGLATRMFGDLHGATVTMRDIVEHIVKPICQLTGTCYAKYKNPDGCRVEAFVTHSWDEMFDDFVNSIEKVFQTHARKPSLWICAFALNQCDSSTIQNQLGVQAGSASLEHSPFVRALKAAWTFVVVRNSVTDLYSRIWCVCELMYAKKLDYVPYKTCVTGSDAFSDLKTSCLDAQAKNVDDRTAVLGALLTDHNVKEIDDFVHEFRQHRAPV